MSADLLAKIAALREGLDTSIQSKEEELPATSLYTVLELINKAPKECYTDYLHGAKALLKYFHPIEIPYKDLPTKILPIPALIDTYYAGELAKVIATSLGYSSIRNLETWLEEINKLHMLIAIHTMRGMI